MNKQELIHHFARLAMMQAEERGEELSYKNAIKLQEKWK